MHFDLSLCDWLANPVSTLVFTEHMRDVIVMLKLVYPTIGNTWNGSQVCECVCVHGCMWLFLLIITILWPRPNWHSKLEWHCSLYSSISNITKIPATFRSRVIELLCSLAYTYTELNSSIVVWCLWTNATSQSRYSHPVSGNYHDCML